MHYVYALLGAVLTTFVGAVVFAILASRGIDPIGKVSGLFAPASARPAAAPETA